MGKEAYDDFQRNQRDREANSQKYLIVESPSDVDASSLIDNGPHTRFVPSSSLRVGDLVHLEKNQRVPADLILLRTSDQSGTCFIRTDQLDGETDWKLRVAVPACQKLPSDKDLLSLDAEIYGKPIQFLLFSKTHEEFIADPPIKDIHTFVGTFTMNSPPSNSTNDVPMVPVPTVEPLTAEHVLWSNTVLAAGSATGFVIYTGAETRAVMNTSHPGTKVGLLDLEVNRLAKVRRKDSSINFNLMLGTDSVRRDIRAFARSGSVERVPRSVVHIRGQVLDSVLVYHSYQVRFINLALACC